jgi:hypothetical protein
VVCTRSHGAIGGRQDEEGLLDVRNPEQQVHDVGHAHAAALYFHKSDGLILWLLVPEGTYDWTMMEARLNAFGNVPEGRTEQCHIEFQFHGEGTLWIDDITIVPTTRRPPVGDS